MLCDKRLGETRFDGGFQFKPFLVGYAVFLPRSFSNFENLLSAFGLSVDD
jgi:hypothetical protein